MLLDKEIEAPPVGAVPDRLTVQVVDWPEFNIAGLQLKVLTAIGGVNATLVVRELPLYVAVIVAAALAEIVPAIAVKLPVEEAAETVTDVGTESSDVLLARATAVPPLGAAPESVTVQVVDWPELRVAGLHDKPVNDSVSARLMLVD